MPVRVYPTFEPTYHTYYLQGLVDVFGSRGIRYTVDGFPWLPRRCLAFITERPQRKVYIDARDPTDLEPHGLAWCDVYAKINIDWSVVTEAQREKLVAIGPHFSIRLWNPPTAAWHALNNYWQARSRIAQTRRHFAGYWQQYKAHYWIDSYIPQPGDPNYVFFSSTLWPNDPACNRFRANFIAACRSIDGLHFEGGLFVRREGLDVPTELRPFVSPHICPIEEYIPRIKRSAVVFNTPAVLGCHGWKLGEYMALGKAIITTPLLRAMPAPLVHGTHAHIVEGSVESLRAAIEQIRADAEYRQRLEHGALAYYREHLLPRRVIERILATAEAPALTVHGPV